MLTGQPERCFDFRFAGTKAIYQYHLQKASDVGTSRLVSKAEMLLFIPALSQRVEIDLHPGHRDSPAPAEIASDCQIARGPGRKPVSR